MGWVETDDVEEHLAAVGHLLLPEPGVHTVSLTVCANALAGAAGSRFARWVSSSGEVTGAVSITPPYPLALAVVPEEAMGELADLWELDGVNGPTQEAVQLAALVAHRTGRRAVLDQATRLFRLGDLTAPQAPGASRPATDDDLPVVTSWFGAFMAEAGVVALDPEVAARDRMTNGGVVLWEVDGRAVSMSGHTRMAFGGVRIGPVYTPPSDRGHGYGGAVTAAASEHARSMGAREVVLFTDLTNPTSNALYPRLGYLPVTDRVKVDLV